jgi:O-antigen/teichoic acid export membrane protein
LKKTILSVISSNILGAGLGFLLNIILARILSLEEFGRINLVLTFIIILFSIFEFNFSNSIVIFYNKEKKDIFDDKKLIYYVNYLFIRYFVSITFISLIILFILRHYYTLSTIEVFVIFINFTMFLLYRYIISLNQAVGDWKKYNLMNILNNAFKLFFTLICLFIFTFITHKFTYYESSLIGFIIFSIIFFIFVLFKSKELIHFVKKIYSNKNYLKIFRNIIIPLGISNLFIVISMRIDILIIEEYLTEKDIAIFAAANILALVFPLITSALRNVYIRQGALEKNNFLVNILKSQKKLLPLILFIFFISILLSKYFFEFLYGSQYSDSVIIFNILIIAYIGGVFFTPLESFFYSHHQKSILLLKFLQMTIVIIFEIILVQYFELVGIAIAIVLSRIFGWIYLILKTRNELINNKKEETYEN